MIKGEVRKLYHRILKFNSCPFGFEEDHPEGDAPFGPLDAPSRVRYLAVRTSKDREDSVMNC